MDVYANDLAYEPIAIIGSSCRFPGGATSPSKLWSLLQDPRDLLTDIPPERFNIHSFYHRDGGHHGSTNVTQSYFCDEDYRLFDHTFFGISRREAEAMDPQQRILLEVVYEGIETAGYSMKSLKGSKTGVYVGQMTADFHDLMNRDLDNISQYAAIGSSRAITANRVSYFFDWHGPSMNTDTACSSSLVALHQAVQSLRDGETDLAVVAGVNLLLGPENYVLESKLQMLSPTGRSRMWDADADGYARGEGFAAVILKPLRQALKQGDHIECVIRETGVNQDGRTGGLTVPNAIAQTDLIESTYRRCGLDCRKKEDRCQYFEAHGTGTKAGDPKEAEAIRKVFFPSSSQMGGPGPASPEEVLYVGSIKTIIGHTEGTAGLAGLIKTSLALQHAMIPPNMHFAKLNPDLEPFYYPHLKVPTGLIPWPGIPKGAPRRASVNSFGFGGTNAHVILESWDPPSSSPSLHRGLDFPWGPFTLSANTDSSLKMMVKSLSETLKHRSDINMADLAWTLQNRRAELCCKIAFPATHRGDLIEMLDRFHSGTSSDQLPVIVANPINVSKSFPLRILGIFTGQGAQWALMGAKLLKHSETFKFSITRMDQSLASLPDPPAWSLVEELAAPESSSRVHSAEISQPLTTALQIALVDLLKASGVELCASVGHSSGEISAVYCANYITAWDAIRIAYYRGLHSGSATPSNLKCGRMMAVGMTFEEALDFCLRFSGSVHVAASNAKSSVTLSGDSDAITEAKFLLDSKGIFARLLKVDRAYHSHHMEECYKPYLESLRHCNIKPRLHGRPSNCKWYSSVYGPDGRSVDSKHSFSDTYWADNMLKPVLFNQAVERAVKEDFCYDLVLEVGPHPALKGPITETFQTLMGKRIPYQGVLRRGEDDMKSFSNALAFIWSNIKDTASTLGFENFKTACVGEQTYKPCLLKGLPSYSWDHDEPLLKESKLSKLWRTNSVPIHELLGRPTFRGSGIRREVQWRNILRLSELPWLYGHQFQDQVLFPASGYISMAIEASAQLATDQEVGMIELIDLKFIRAISLDEDSPGTELIFSIKTLHQDSTCIEAEYVCYTGNVDANSSTGKETEYVNFTGRATIYLGIATQSELPPRSRIILPLSQVKTDRFYSWTSSIGLRYSGDFLAYSIERRQNMSTITVNRVADSKLRIHPATLDAAFHGIFAAYSFPGDRKMSRPFLPSSIDSVRVDMSQFTDLAKPPCYKNRKSLHGHHLVADCYVRGATATSVSGDVDLFCTYEACNHPELQVQGLTCSSITVPTVDDDRAIFSRIVWKRETSNRLSMQDLPECSGEDREIYDVYERIAYFYMRSLASAVSRTEMSGLEWNHRNILEWTVDHILPKVESGKHPRVRADWASDTYDSIMCMKAKHPDTVEFQLLQAVGTNILSIIRGDVSALQVLMEDGMLPRFYKEGRGTGQANELLGLQSAQLSHQYPKMKILEIGAGTGGATVSVLNHLSSFDSYTFTDISPAFFENAKKIFSDHQDKMNYQILDIERCPLEQGFEEHSYDLIIASNVLHATHTLAKTMENCRKLLRPGGRLFMLEFTADTLYLQFIISGLPGWWLGRADNRTYSPTVSESRWDSILRDSGFSGVDNVFRDFQDESIYSFSVMTSQAVDSRVQLLREPLAAKPDSICIENLVILGGQSLQISNIARKIHDFLRPWASNVNVIHDWAYIGDHDLSPGSAVVCLSDLDGGVLDNADGRRLRAIQAIFNKSNYVLWVTKGSYSDNPDAIMSVGMGRSIMMECPHLRLQFVDIDAFLTHQPEATILSEMLLRLIYLSSEGYKDIMWSIETEMAIIEGDFYVPRVLPDQALNNRFNSGQRVIEKTLQVENTLLRLNNISGGLLLEEITDLIDASSAPDSARFTVDSSSLFPMSTTNSLAPNYLCLGRFLNSTPTYFAMSPINTSTFKTSVSGSFINRAGMTVGYIFSLLLAESLCMDLDGTLWLHDAQAWLVNVFLQVTISRDIQLFLTTSSPTSIAGATFIHPRASVREIQSLIPQSVQKFVYMGQGENQSLLKALQSCLPAGVALQQWHKIAHRDQTIHLSYSTERLYKIIESHCQILRPQTTTESERSTSIAMLPTSPCKHGPTDTIDWRSGELTVRMRPITSKGMFSQNKTYFLAGLASDLGMSLVEWMTANGAKHFAVTSRNPRLNPQVLQYLKGKGAIIRVFPCDITERKALHQVYQEIVSSMPPIAGVANAAMVLHDKSFSSMSMDEMEAVLRPKVKGSKLLDELFFSDKLEFFILFSSMSCIIGNQGQSNYAAANIYMSALARRRRKRGVAASIIHIAMLLGLGHVARSLDSGSIAEAQLRKSSFMALSESDMHVIFAEAILSGLPDSGMDPEILTGFDTDHQNAPWGRIPMFSHFICNKNSPMQEKQRILAQGSIRSQLSAASSTNEILAIVEAAFASKLGVMLQTSADDIDRGAPLVSLGIDSLVAVEARSWFLKELEIDMPILSILSGKSLTDICKVAMINLEDVKTSRETDISKIIAASARSLSLSESSVEPSPSLDSQSDETISNADLTPTSSEATSGSPLEDTAPVQEFPLSSEIMNRAFRRVGPMSRAQKRLFFLHEFLDDKSACNVGYLGTFRGRLNQIRFKKALNDVFQQHETLRSSYFIDESGEAVQGVNSEPRFILEHHQIADEEDVQSLIHRERSFQFDINAGLTMKVTILSLAPTTHYILFLHHHIALDGLSWHIFTKDLHTCYSGETLKTPVLHAIDTSRKEQHAKNATNLNKELQFWVSLHENPHEPLPLLSFANVQNRSFMTKYESETAYIQLDDDLAQLAKRTAYLLRVTPASLYLSVFATFLLRVFNVDDFSIGLIDANRTDDENSETLGYFLNLLPLRFKLKPQTSFANWAEQTRNLVFAALANSRVPFDMILEHLRVPHTGTHHPLFQAMLNYRQGYSSHSSFGEGVIEWSPNSISARSSYDLAVEITEVPDCTYIHWTTQKYLYESTESKMLMNRFTHILRHVCNNHQALVDECPLGDERELKIAYALGQGPTLDITWEGTIAHRVEAVVAKYPDSVALIDDDGNRLTYTQLWAQAVRVAHAVHSSQTPRGSYVGMLLHPSSDHVCAFLGLMLAGMVCIPMDLRNPDERLHAMVSDALPTVLICSEATEDKARRLAQCTRAQVVNIDSLSSPENRKVENMSQVDHTAVILYTSGSTGVPKGVLLTHRGIRDHIFANSSLFGIGREIVLQQSPLGFDLSLDQTFTPLANGGTLVVVGKDGRGDPTHLANVILAENVTYTLFVPTEYLSLLNYGFDILKKCKSWRFAFSLGEKLTPQVRRAFKRLDCQQIQLVNAYGPTEGTIACSRGKVPYHTDADILSQSDHLLTMPGYSVFILDEQLNPQPVSLPGEICIGGVGVASGYLNSPEKTKHSFIEVNTASLSAGTKKSTTFYRTGDSGRLLEDGSLQFLGRMTGDSQVKIRGNRVELDEIASVIVRQAKGAISGATALYRQQPDVLIAFVVFESSFSGDRGEFISELGSALPLPSYMRPTLITPIDQIPTNLNGKQDRSAIDKLPIPLIDCQPREELSPVEIRMKEVWEAVLSDGLGPLAPINSKSEFFQVGGNSMLVIKLRSVLQTVFGLTIPLPELFELETLGNMAKRVENETQMSSIPIVKEDSGIIDWDQELTALCDGLPLSESEGVFKEELALAGSELKIILTGATGFLGSNILQKLVASDRVKEVHCVAIRPNKSGQPRQLSLSSHKIFVYSGDLTEPHLGLPRSQFLYLAKTVDLIIHSGAEMSYLRGYQSLRNTNVLSTRTLCELAISRRVPFHFISTAAVASLIDLRGNGGILDPVSVTSRGPLSHSNDGYSLTKWVSEALLEKVATHSALPVYIHRPVSIVGDGAPDSDLMTSIFQYSHILEAVPDLNGARIDGSFDWVNVQDVSEDILRVVLGTQLIPTNKAHYVHYCNDEKVLPSEFQKYIERRQGREIEVMSIEKWLDSALRLGMSRPLYHFLVESLSSRQRVVLPVLSK